MTRWSRGLALTGSVLAILTRASSSALAAEAAAHGAHRIPVIGDLLLPAINFSIYAFIIVRYLVPAMREYMRRRREQILSDVQGATAALNSGEQAIADARKRLGLLEAEAENIRRDLVAVAGRQTDRLRKLAEESGKRHLEDARLLAEQERRRALQGIRSDIASLATRAAEQRIRASLSPDDQRRFVRQLLEDVAAR